MSSHPRSRRARTPASRAAARSAWAWRIGTLAVLLALWAALAAAEIWPPAILPAPAAVWQRFIQSVTVHDGDVTGLSGYFLWQHLWASLWRLIQGIVMAIVIGVPLGLLLATWRPARLALGPIVDFVRSLPPLAYFSLLIIWFGIEDSSKIWLLFLAAIAPIALSVVSGVEGSRIGWRESARALGASRRQVLVHTILPATLPELFTGIRLAIGFAFTTIVAAETVNGIPGIGGLAWETKKFQQTDIAILCVIVIGITAVVIDQAIRAVERRAVPWKGRA
jgi:taurine transport system permease protein